ncbi:cysteine proteinase [Coniochaeta ligniaria NRRL 30616]|uniref:ubiquitinyl hydrolase 1 n=1 Tax=Coniochaeta ligniaria NRRL 30616 TaxID=1408157 RepID=A0A1J7J9P5_9PEZI|nr:cysteine proteinase [Coniochaeta ligniaria NRRL 30616]
MRVETEQPVMVDDSPRPGRLAPRWLHDLYMGILADREGDTGDLFTRCEHLPDRLSLTDASARPPNGHELLSIDIQCPEATVKSQLISCICRHCKYHFLFHFEQDSPSICPTPHNSNNENGKAALCHLVLAESQVMVPTAEDVFNPVTQTGTWRCSSPTCSFKVSVAISKPRMKMEHIKLVVDEKRIAHQRQQAIELDPVRFNPQTLKNDMEYTALTTLNAYLRDCLGKTVDEQPKRIATRNKRFYIQFGASSSHIFEYLGLEKRVIDDEDYWFLPELEHYPNEKTPINTQRAFIEDARSEIQALIEEQGGQQSGGVVKPWSEALFKLKRALNCPWWDTAGGKKPEDADADFRLLGTLPNPNEDMLKYAYQRQVDADPLRRKVYCDALQRLASHRSVDLQIFTVTEASLIEQQEASFNTPLAQAYSHFNLPADCTESDDFVINRYLVFFEQSPAQKMQHRQKLFLIGHERKSKSIMEQAARGFSFEEACDYLQLEPGVKAGNSPDLAVLDYYVDQAVEVGSSTHVSPPTSAFFLELLITPIKSYAADVKRQGFLDAGATYANLLGAQDQITVSNEGQQIDLSLPPGLDNLRNTCYLNSILQYLYTVTPVRELVLNYDPAAVGLSEDLANQNEEVYLGREFTRELQRLFKDLGSASTKFVKPQQRLANAAWLSPDKVNADAAQKNSSKQPTPPPLPARPAPIPNSQQANVDPTVVTVAPIDLTNDESPAASMASSQTLINLPLESSFEMMERDEQPPVIDKQKSTAADVHPEAQSQLRALMAALDQTEVVGTDQMDVEEVMGRCINHLRAAVNPGSVIHANDAEHHRDIITDTFYISFASMRMEMGKDQYNRSISYERWVTANPGVDGPVHLYEALDNFFDREMIGEKILSYTAIVKPPPIFHVCIQRSKVGGGKNTNPVAIPEVLFLDRYMEAEESSPVYKARARSWAIKAQLENIAAIKAPKKAEAAAESGPSATAAASIEESIGRHLNNWSFEPGVNDPDTTDEDYVVINPEVKTILDASPVSESTSSPSFFKPREPFQHPALEVDLSAHIDTDLQTREDVLKAELETLFTGLESERYRLHAVICHAGQTAKSGHYWVWIYDFGARVWRKYNDTTVTERREDESKALLEELSKAGEPYYLAYVREEGLEGLVEVPGRRINEVVEEAGVLEVDPEMMQGVEKGGMEELPAYDG